MTSERLAQMSTIEAMVKAILAKSGVVSYLRVLRIIQDALIVQGNPQALIKEDILSHLVLNSALIDPKTQLFIAKSSLIFGDSRRKTSLRDTMIVMLTKQGVIDVD